MTLKGSGSLPGNLHEGEDNFLTKLIADNLADNSITGFKQGRQNLETRQISITVGFFADTARCGLTVHLNIVFIDANFDQSRNISVERMVIRIPYNETASSV